MYLSRGGTATPVSVGTWGLGKQMIGQAWSLPASPNSCHQPVSLRWGQRRVPAWARLPPPPRAPYSSWVGDVFPQDPKASKLALALLQLHSWGTWTGSQHSIEGRSYSETGKCQLVPGGMWAAAALGKQNHGLAALFSHASHPAY